MAPLDELVGGPVRSPSPASGSGRPSVRAVIVKEPINSLDTMHVILPGFSQTSYYEVPGDQWAAAGGLPKKDDECLIVFDDENDAWAITAGTGGGGTSSLLDWKGHVANYAALPVTAIDGDAWVTDDTSHLYVWQEPLWVDLGELTGPPGPAGAPGAPGAPGPPGALQVYVQPTTPVGASVGAIWIET